MNCVFIVMLVFSILLKFFPPKKPNYYYGYQLGNAKKSIEHWKVANRIAANYIFMLASITLTLSVIVDYQAYDGGILILAVFLIGFILIYWLIEKRLKRIDNGTSDTR